MRTLTLALITLSAGFWLCWISRPDCRPGLRELANEVAWYAPRQTVETKKPNLLNP